VDEKINYITKSYAEVHIRSKKRILSYGCTIIMAHYKFSTMMMTMTIMMIKYLNVLYIRSVQNTLAAGFFSVSSPVVEGGLTGLFTVEGGLSGLFPVEGGLTGLFPPPLSPASGAVVVEHAVQSSSDSSVHCRRPA